MRFSALIPVVLCAGALALAFLCLFAGSSPGFMEEYAILTLNASRIGVDLVNGTTHDTNNPFVALLSNVSAAAGRGPGDVAAGLNVNSVAKQLGLHDFYSTHVLDYCEGYYVPAAVPNATVGPADIHKNVTACAARSALFSFDPRQTLQQELDASGHANVNLTDLQWPAQVDAGLRALRAAQVAMFVLYCVGIGLSGIALLLALGSVGFEGRLSAFVNVVVDGFAFAALGVASALATVVAVKATQVINQYGQQIDVSATMGGKFLIITWVATGAMLVASVVWCLDCIVGRRSRHRESPRKGSYEDSRY